MNHDRQKWIYLRFIKILFVRKEKNIFVVDSLYYIITVSDSVIPIIVCFNTNIVCTNIIYRNTILYYNTDTNTFFSLATWPLTILLLSFSREEKRSKTNTSLSNQLSWYYTFLMVLYIVNIKYSSAIIRITIVYD